MTSVTVREPEDVHVAGLLLARLLEAAVRARPDLALGGNVLVDAGGMKATVVPRGDRLEVSAGVVEPVVARVRAPLATLVDVAGGASELRALLRGLRASGSLRVLWTFRTLLRAARRSA